MFGRKKRPKQVLCTCRNCKGQFIPRTTRDSHTRADKIHSTLQKEDSARKPQEPSPSPMNSNPFLQFSVAERDPQLNRCTLIKEEVELLSGVPLANPTAPLIFKYDPETHDACISSPPIQTFFNRTLVYMPWKRSLVPTPPFFTQRTAIVSFSKYFRQSHTWRWIASRIQRIFYSGSLSACPMRKGFNGLSSEAWSHRDRHL